MDGSRPEEGTPFLEGQSFSGLSPTAAEADLAVLAISMNYNDSPMPDFGYNPFDANGSSQAQSNSSRYPDPELLSPATQSTWMPMQVQSQPQPQLQLALPAFDPVQSWAPPHTLPLRPNVGGAAGTFGQMGAMSGPFAAAHTAGQILSDQPRPSHLFPLPCGTYPNNMTTAAPLQQSPDLRNDSVVGQGDNKLSGFRTYPNAASPLDVHGRMGSISGVQYSQPSAAVAGSVSPTNAPAGKVAIPALDRNNSTASTSGPIRGNWNVKPRPKPGRKPMQDDPTSKRKLQNRHAQRAFRDRRAQKVHDLEIENGMLKEQHEDERNQWRLSTAKYEADADNHRRCISQLEAELQRLRDENSKLHKTIESTKASSHSSHQSHHSVHALLTPPDSTNDDMEIDFTHMFTTRKPAPLASIGSPIGEDDHCGFCTNPDNCLCRQKEEDMDDHDLNKGLPPMDPSRAHNPPALPSGVSAPSFLEAPTNATGPGTCDMCLADPEKARQCRELAQSTHFASSVPIPTVPLPGRINLDSSKANERMSCSDFFTSARQKNLQLGPEHYRRIAHIYPYHANAGRSGHSPAMELDAHDAAEALTALSRQDTRSGADRQ